MRDLVLQGREAHGRGAHSRETNSACDRGFCDRLRRRRRLQTYFRPTFPRSDDGARTFCIDTWPCFQPAARRWPQFAAGRDIIIDHRNRSDELEKVRLAQSEMDTPEPELTQTDVTDQHG